MSRDTAHESPVRTRALRKATAVARTPQLLHLRALAVTAIAAGAAWASAAALTTLTPAWVAATPIVAAITAVLTVRTSLHQASSSAGGQLLAVIIGAGAALIIADMQLPDWAGASLAVFTALTVAWALRLGEEASIGVPITALIVLGPGLHENAAIERFTGTLIGAVIGVTASILTHPDTPARRAADLVAGLGDDIASLLAELAEGGRRRFNLDEALTWLETARSINDRIPTAKHACEEAVAYARWAPTASRAEAAALYARFLSVEHTVITTRALTRSMLDVAEQDVALPADTRAALSDALEAASEAVETHASTLTDSVEAAIDEHHGPQIPDLLTTGTVPDVEAALTGLTETTADLARAAEDLATRNTETTPDPAATLTAHMAVSLQRIADSLAMDTAAIHTVTPDPDPAPATAAAEALTTGIAAPARLVLRQRRRRARSTTHQ